MFSGVYKGKKVLVTGHAGFCGSWLSLWLKKLGAEVIGFGHPPRTVPNHYYILHPQEVFLARFNKGHDLLDYAVIHRTIKKEKPDIVFHIAAKAIVARTFSEPKETFENNIMATVNLLEACRLENVRGIVDVTTDKVYADMNWIYGYREEGDKLGGIDPYSASKVCCEHVIQSYRESFGMNIAVARAGNVIGGGDWSEKRLIPDIVRATAKGEKVIIHTPNATRPFQHVLDALYGYLLLGQKILEGEDVNEEFNFGPTEDISVLEILKIAKKIWPEVEWEIDEASVHPYMIYLLKLDSTKAKRVLSWSPLLSISRAVEWTIGWYRNYYQKEKVSSEDNITTYEKGIQRNGM